MQELILEEENDVIFRYEGNIPETPDKSRVYRNRK